MNQARVYPRVCGGTQAQVVYLVCTLKTMGSIPACAGEPRPSISQIIGPHGLSPRVRGNPIRTVFRVSGSIPACAGEPHDVHGSADAVYPRVCGGTHDFQRACSTIRPRSIPACAGEPASGSSLVPQPVLGLSPRVRGNPRKLMHHGSIPACTEGLSPRVLGLSPRVRGNLRLEFRSIPLGTLARSIPACAGEPLSQARSMPACAVHQRSIPACAGETFQPTCRSRSKVYPRVCGGTRLLPSCHRSIPACAGEPSPISRASNLIRSIPACAGEPHACHSIHRGLSPRVRGNRDTVYPRVEPP